MSDTSDVNSNYGHPSFLVRQMEYLGNTTAGNGTKSFVCAFPGTLRIRRATGTVRTAGTSTGASVSICYQTGTATSTIATIALSTAAVGTILPATFVDNNIDVPLGSLFYAVNGTDATASVGLLIECHYDPEIP